MSLEHICPVIISRDAATTIERTLRSLAQFPHVIVYDNGSTDRTIEVCEAFPNVRVVRGEFFGFGPTYNHAAELAPGDWILSIHADEEVSAELLESLGGLELGEANVAYALDRHNVFMGKDVRRAGWGDDWLVRLYNRRTCRFDDAPVHEKMLVPPGTKVVRVRGPLWHEAVTDIDQFVQKVSRYSELRRSARGRVHSPPVILLRAGWAFFRTYVLQLGVLEGWRGMVIAMSNANGTFFRHMKRYVDARVTREPVGSGEAEASSSSSSSARGA